MCYFAATNRPLTWSRGTFFLTAYTQEKEVVYESFGLQGNLQNNKIVEF